MFYARFNVFAGLKSMKAHIFFLFFSLNSQLVNGV